MHDRMRAARPGASAEVPKPRRGAMGTARSDEAVLVGEGGRRGARRHVELREDVADVAVDGPLADRRARRRSPGWSGRAATRRSTSTSRALRPAGSATAPGRLGEPRRAAARSGAAPSSREHLAARRRARASAPSTSPRARHARPIRTRTRAASYGASSIVPGVPRPAQRRAARPRRRPPRAGPRRRPGRPSPGAAAHRPPAATAASSLGRRRGRPSMSPAASRISTHGSSSRAARSSVASSRARRIAAAAAADVALREPEQREPGFGRAGPTAGLAVAGLGRRTVTAQSIELGQLVVRLADRRARAAVATASRGRAAPRRSAPATARGTA